MENSQYPLIQSPPYTSMSSSNNNYNNYNNFGQYPIQLQPPQQQSQQQKQYFQQSNLQSAPSLYPNYHHSQVSMPGNSHVAAPMQLATPSTPPAKPSTYMTAMVCNIIGLLCCPCYCLNIPGIILACLNYDSQEEAKKKYKLSIQLCVAAAIGSVFLLTILIIATVSGNLPDWLGSILYGESEWENFSSDLDRISRY